jgi:hypothetical protein
VFALQGRYGRENELLGIGLSVSLNQYFLHPKLASSATALLVETDGVPPVTRITLPVRAGISVAGLKLIPAPIVEGLAKPGLWSLYNTDICVTGDTR